MKISPVISFLIYPFLIQRFEDLDLRRDKNIWTEISRITSLFFQSRMWFDVTKEKRKWKQKIINDLARKKVDEPLHLKNCIKLWAVFTIVTEILLSTKNRFFRKCHKKNMVNAIREFFFFRRNFSPHLSMETGRVFSLEFAISSRRQLLEDFWNEMETRFLPARGTTLGPCIKQRRYREATKVLDTSPIRAMFTRKYWKWRTRSRVAELKRVSNEFEYTCKYTCVCPGTFRAQPSFQTLRSREKQTRIESVWESFSNDRFSPEKKIEGR